MTGENLVMECLRCKTESRHALEDDGYSLKVYVCSECGYRIGIVEMIEQPEVMA